MNHPSYHPCSLRRCDSAIFRPLALWLLIGLLLAPPPMSAQAQSEVTRGTLIIGVATDIPPFAAQTTNGQSIGFDLDIIKTLVRTAGLRVTYEAVPFIQLIPGVATQLYDAAIGCMADTEERRALVDFSAAYFTTGDVLVISDNSPPLYDLTDLTPEITVSTVAESASWGVLTQQSTANVVTTASAPEALALAATRIADAAFVDEISTDHYMRAHPEARLRIVSGLVTTGQCAIAVSKDNPRLLRELNAALTRLKNNGKYLTIYHRWFGSRPLTGPRPVSRPTPIAAPTQAPMAATVAPSAAQATVLADAVVGVYTLTLLTEPPVYQTIELAQNGWWLESLVAPNTDALQGGNPLMAGQLSVQQGRWQVVSSDPVALTVQISATLYLSATLDSSRAENGVDERVERNAEKGENTDVAPALPPRREYQLAIQEDGTVRGAYTLYTSNAPTSTQLLTSTMALLGQRVVQ